MAEQENVGEWYEVTALVRDEKIESIPLGEVRDQFRVQGQVEGITVVQFCALGLTPDQVQQSIQAIQIMLRQVGIEKAVIIPDGIEMMRLKKVDPEVARALNLSEHGTGDVH